MKKFALALIAMMLLLVGGLLVFGLTQPRQSSVVREVSIEAPLADVQATLLDLTTWPDWSYWTKEVDPQAEFSFEGPHSQVNMVWNWESEGPLGVGSLELTGVSPERIDLVLNFDPEGANISNETFFLLSESDGVTHVHWQLDAELDNIIWRITAGLGFLDKMVGEQYETGLINLKDRLEATPAESAPADGQEEQGE